MLKSALDAITLQTAMKNPEDFIERFSERIQALSANHDPLIRNEWNGVEIKHLVRAQLAHFADLIGARVAVHGPKLRLNAASAQAIGLALHELATNAGKYGALSTDAGRVDVSLGERWRHLHHELNRARWAARAGAETARVRHYRYRSDGEAQRRWHGRPRLCALRRDLALDLHSSERAGARGTCVNFTGRENRADGSRNWRKVLTT